MELLSQLCFSFHKMQHHRLVMDASFLHRSVDEALADVMEGTRTLGGQMFLRIIYSIRISRTNDLMIWWIVLALRSNPCCKGVKWPKNMDRQHAFDSVAVMLLLICLCRSSMRIHALRVVSFLLASMAEDSIGFLLVGWLFILCYDNRIKHLNIHPVQLNITTINFITQSWW